MNDLLLTPHSESVFIGQATQDSGSSWSLSKKRGNIVGVGAEVSGKGAWVRLSGDMDFSAKKVESSSTYRSMKTEYGISGGISGFWAWLSVHANASAHKTEIERALQEMSSSIEAHGHIHIDMYVTGLYPGQSVSASAYVLVMEVSNQSGQRFIVASDGAPTADTGAQDQHGNQLPNNDNNSTINL